MAHVWVPTSLFFLRSESDIDSLKGRLKEAETGVYEKASEGLVRWLSSEEAVWKPGRMRSILRTHVKGEGENQVHKVVL